MHNIAHRIIEIASLIALAAGTYVSTLYSVFYSTPNCITNHRGFGAGLIPFLAAMISIPLFVLFDTFVRRRRGPRQTRWLIVCHAFAAAAVVFTLVLTHFLLCGPILHLGEHNCNLTPWSP